MRQHEFYKTKLRYETDSLDLSESLSNGGDVIVIDARAPDAYEIEHIPTAINIPKRIMTSDTSRGRVNRATLLQVFGVNK